MELVALGSAAEFPCGTLDARLDGVQVEAGLLDVLARASGKDQVRVQGRVPPGQEAALDLGVLGQAGLTHTLLRKGVLLESRGERVLAGARVLLVEGLAAGQAGAGDRVVEGLGLRLGARRGREGSLGLSGAGSRREESHLLADGATKVLEGLLDVGRIVVGLVGVLRAVSSGT